jgi:chemotaxis protein histidine kinase CheA
VVIDIKPYMKVIIDCIYPKELKEETQNKKRIAIRIHEKDYRVICSSISRYSHIASAGTTVTFSNQHVFSYFSTASLFSPFEHEEKLAKLYQRMQELQHTQKLIDHMIQQKQEQRQQQQEQQEQQEQLQQQQQQLQQQQQELQQLRQQQPPEHLQIEQQMEQLQQWVQQREQQENEQERLEREEREARRELRHQQRLLQHSDELMHSYIEKDTHLLGHFISPNGEMVIYIVRKEGGLGEWRGYNFAEGKQFIYEKVSGELSTLFVTQYCCFFEQYSKSHSIFSADSQSFIVPHVDGILIQRVYHPDEAPIMVDQVPSHFAFFSPCQ